MDYCFLCSFVVNLTRNQFTVFQLTIFHLIISVYFSCFDSITLFQLSFFLFRKNYADEILIWSEIASSGARFASDKSVQRRSCDNTNKNSKKTIENRNCNCKQRQKCERKWTLFRLMRKHTCSDSVKCESPLSASGSGSFSAGT